MQSLAERLDALRPYPELSPEHAAVVRTAFDHRPPLSSSDLAFVLGVPEQVVLEAQNLRLVSTLGGQVVPTILGLLYVDSDEARRLVSEVDAMMRAIASLYRPGSWSVVVDDAVAAAGLSADRADAIQPYLDPLGYRLVSLEPRAYGAQPSFLYREGLSEFVARLRQSDRAAHEREIAEHGEDPALLDPPGPFRLHWTGIEVQNFRALRNVRLDFPSTLTVLAGTNSAGKSTLLDAAAFVGHALLEGLTHALEAQNGIARLKTRGAEGPVEITTRFTADLGAGRAPGEYSFALDAAHGVTRVERESLAVGAGDARIVLVDRRRAVASIRSTAGRLDTIHPSLDELVLAPSDESEPPGPITPGIATDLGRVLLLDRDPRIRARSTAARVAGRSRWAASIDVLLDQAVRDSASAERVGEVLHELVPAVRTVRRSPATRGPARFTVLEVDGDEPARIDELSSGTLQMLLLAAVYVHPEPPSLLLVEEPDAGLHVGALRALRDLLRSIAGRTTVLATSHSPIFLGSLDPGREVVIVERDDRGVRTRSFADARSDRAWLAAFAPGDEAFVRMGMEKR